MSSIPEAPSPSRGTTVPPAAGTLADGRVAWDARVRHLYVHVPFCAHKCEYCAFFSEVPRGDLMDRYVAALVREMELVAADLQPRTIYFGGGTPSLLTIRHWETILTAMGRHQLLGADEFTVECNPATVAPDKARLLRDHGVNRISMGVQSLDADLLERLGRIHSRPQVFQSFETLRAAGFDNVNLDLMFAIPGQTLSMWQATLREALALGSEHVSSYEVIYEEDTALFAQLQAGEFSVDEDLACAMYDELVATAGAAGLGQYEVANFARDTNPARAGGIPALVCRHNVNYWRAGAFHGLGPSATGYVRGLRTRNWANTTLYCEQLEKGRRAHESTETLPALARAGEAAAFGMRMNAGWPYVEFAAATGFDLRHHWAEDIAELAAAGLVESDGNALRPTPLGLRFADTVAEHLLRPEKAAAATDERRDGAPSAPV